MLGLGRVGAYLYLKFFTCSLPSRTVSSGQGKTLGVTIKAQCVLSNGWKLLLLSFFFSQMFCLSWDLRLNPLFKEVYVRLLSGVKFECLNNVNITQCVRVCMYPFQNTMN